MTARTTYLLHFFDPATGLPARYQHAGHYLGDTEEGREEGRLQEHRDGIGSVLTAAARRAGLDFIITRTWPGGAMKARQLKSRSGASYCPKCNEHPLPGIRLRRPGAKYLTRRQREARQRAALAAGQEQAARGQHGADGFPWPGQAAPACPGCEDGGRGAHTPQCDERERAVAQFLAEIGAEPRKETQVTGDRAEVDITSQASPQEATPEDVTDPPWARAAQHEVGRAPGPVPDCRSAPDSREHREAYREMHHARWGAREHDPATEIELGERVLDPMRWENGPDRSLAHVKVTRAADLADTAREPTYYDDLKEIRANQPEWPDQACREVAGGRQHARRLAERMGVSLGDWRPLPGRGHPDYFRSAPGSAEHRADYREMFAESDGIGFAHRDQDLGYEIDNADELAAELYYEELAERHYRELHAPEADEAEPGPDAARWVPGKERDEREMAGELLNEHAAHAEDAWRRERLATADEHLAQLAHDEQALGWARQDAEMARAARELATRGAYVAAADMQRSALGPELDDAGGRFPLPRILPASEVSPIRAPVAATLPDGTPHADPLLAGHGWQAHGGVYVRQPQAQLEAG